MTAHILVPSVDPSGDPATLSQPIMTGNAASVAHDVERIREHPLVPANIPIYGTSTTSRAAAPRGAGGDRRRQGRLTFLGPVALVVATGQHNGFGVA